MKSPGFTWLRVNFLNTINYSIEHLLNKLIQTNLSASWLLEHRDLITTIY